MGPRVLLCIFREPISPEWSSLGGATQQKARHIMRKACFRPTPPPAHTNTLACLSSLQRRSRLHNKGRISRLKISTGNKPYYGFEAIFYQQHLRRLLPLSRYSQEWKKTVKMNSSCYRFMWNLCVLSTSQFEFFTTETDNPHLEPMPTN